MPIELAIQAESSAAESKPSLWTQLNGLLVGKPTSEDRMFFTEQLSLLLETGSALLTALQSIRKQITNPAMTELVDDLIDSVTGGSSFSHALSKHPELFSTTYVNLVAAAETGGFMHRVLDELVRMEEKRDELRRTVTGALSYPGFLMVFSVAVVIFVLVAVFPKFADLFEGIQDELPGTTVFLMGASRVLLDHWLALLIGLVAVVAILVWWFRSETGIAFIDQVKMRTPVLKDIFIQVYLIQSLRVMGLSMANGVTVPDTLVSCREVVSNKTFQVFLNRVEHYVSEGAGFAIGFNETDFIPVTVKQMISTGEESGNLPKVLGRISEYYERELHKRLATFARAIEPIMLVFMGGVVGLIVSSLILPIFKLSQSV